MKIAHISPVMVPVPPPKYGGTEQVVKELALGLTAKGHEVTIFGPHGSGFENKNIKIIECAPIATLHQLSQNRKWEIHEFLKVIALQHQFDFLHFHYEPLTLQSSIDGRSYNFMSYIEKPFLVTGHSLTDNPAKIDYYQTHSEIQDFHYVFLTHKQREVLSFLRNAHVIHHGISVPNFTFNDQPQDYLFFIGRMAPYKGILTAIEVAKLTGKKLIVAAKVDATERDFYRQKVRPLIDQKQIIYLGEVNFEEKIHYYKNALCTLFPIEWEEPFGLVMIESLACGTPVIAFRRGSVPEIMVDGKTGFIVDDLNGMIESVGKISQISRAECRHYVEENFSSERMVNLYEELYRTIVQAK